MASKNIPMKQSNDLDALLKALTPPESDDRVQFHLRRGELDVLIGSIQLLQGETVGNAFTRFLCRGNILRVPIGDIAALILTGREKYHIDFPLELIHSIQQISGETFVDDLEAIERFVSMLRGLIYFEFSLIANIDSHEEKVLVYFSHPSSQFEGDNEVVQYMRPLR